MNTWLFFAILLFSGLGYLWTARRSARRLRDNNDYFLSGRGLGLFSLTMTLLATQFGGCVLLGGADLAYKYGWAALLYPLGQSLGFCLLAAGYGARLRERNLGTVVELFESVYKARSLRQIAAVLSIVSMFLILVAQGIAVKKFFGALGWDSTTLFVIFWTVIVAYTVIGGLNAVVSTDIQQMLFVIPVLVFTLFAITLPEPAALPAMPIPTEGSSPWAGWLFMPLFFMLIEQDMGQRCFAAKSPRTVSIACYLAGAALFICALFAIYLGNLARDIGFVPGQDQSTIMGVVQLLTGPNISAFFAAALLMVIVSTASPLLCSLSSNLALDLLPGRSVGLSQVITAIAGAAAVLLSLMFTDIVTVLIFSYELSVSVLFVPVVVAVMTSAPCKRAAIVSMAAGAAGFLLCRMVDLPFPRELVAVVLSGAGYGLSRTVSRLVPAVV